MASKLGASITYIGEATRSTVSPVLALQIDQATSGPTIIGSEAGRILIVTLSSVTNGAQAASNVTLGGQTFTYYRSVSSAANSIHAEIWYLLNPSAGAAITNTVATFSAATNAVCNVGYYSGVDQAQPFGASASTSVTASSTNISITVSTLDPNSWVFVTETDSNRVSSWVKDAALTLRRNNFNTVNQRGTFSDTNAIVAVGPHTYNNSITSGTTYTLLVDELREEVLPTATPSSTATATLTATPSITETPVPGSCVASYLAQWGSSGTGNGQFDSAHGVAIGLSGNVYVSDFNGNRVQVFSPSGTYLWQWGSYGTGNGQFFSPNGIATDVTGNVYVVETNGSRVQEFDSNGAYIRQWGSLGSGAGQFNGPEGLAVDAAGYVYVAEYWTNRIQKFSSNGTLITQWGTTGSGDGQFNNANGIGVAPSGDIYVTDFSNNRIQQFTSTGVFIGKWGGPGSGNGQFNAPGYVAVRPNGNVYVSDGQNNRIQEFSSTGAYLAQWGGTGTGNGQFTGLAGLAVGPSNLVYVSDAGNYRIQEFGCSAGTPTPSETMVPTGTLSYTFTPTFTPTRTATPVLSPTQTPTLTVTPSATLILTATPSYTFTPILTPTFTDTPTPAVLVPAATPTPDAGNIRIPNIGNHGAADLLIQLRGLPPGPADMKAYVNGIAVESVFQGDIGPSGSIVLHWDAGASIASGTPFVLVLKDSQGTVYKKWSFYVE